MVAYMHTLKVLCIYVLKVGFLKYFIFTQLCKVFCSKITFK